MANNKKFFHILMKIRPRNLLANKKIIIPDIDEDKTQESVG